MAIKFKELTGDAIVWRSGYYSKFSSVYNRIRKLKMGKTLHVTLDAPNHFMGTQVNQNFRMQRVPYRVRSMKLDPEGKVWAFKKEVRKK